MANSFINKKADLTTTNLTTVYTVPSFKTSVIKSILVSEDAGSGANITVTLVDASSNIFSLFKSKTISSNTTVELLTQPLVMEASERGKNIMQTIKPEKIITTISNLKTGEVYKSEDEWKTKGVPEADIRRDVKVIMPALDLFPKTK
jgi:hypothetical protein